MEQWLKIRRVNEKSCLSQRYKIIKHSLYEVMFGTLPKVSLTSSLIPVNMVEKLKTGEELQAALESMQVLSNDKENNEAIYGVEKEDVEDQTIDKQTKTRQISIDQNRK